MPLLRPAYLPGAHVRVFPPDEVTSRNEAGEADPGEAGLTRAGVDEIWSAVERLYRTGLHPAIALCLRRRGKVVIDRAIGHVRGNAPGARGARGEALVRATHRSLFDIFSCSKAVTAMLVHLLDERGQVHLDDPVCEYIPGFGKHGKDWVTLRHILTHRAGIPAVPLDQADPLSLLTDPARVVELLCEARPISVPGRRLAYHALTGGFVLGEVIRRVTGRDVRRFLGDEVLTPLGFDTFNYGVDPSRVGEVAECALTGLPPMPPVTGLIKRSLGAGPVEAVAAGNDPRYMTSVVPSGNIIGTAEEGSRFFELLLRGGEMGGVKIFDRRTVRRAVAEQTFLEVDSFLGLPVRYGMGFMLGGELFSPYGPRSPQAFGHVGFTTVLLWADPERDISVALMTSGKPFVTPGQVYWLGVPRAIAGVCPRDGGLGAESPARLAQLSPGPRRPPCSDRERPRRRLAATAATGGHGDDWRPRRRLAATATAATGGHGHGDDWRHRHRHRHRPRRRLRWSRRGARRCCPKGDGARRGSLSEPETRPIGQARPGSASERPREGELTKKSASRGRVARKERLTRLFFGGNDPAEVTRRGRSASRGPLGGRNGLARPSVDVMRASRGRGSAGSASLGRGAAGLFRARKVDDRCSPDTSIRRGG